MKKLLIYLFVITGLSFLGYRLATYSDFHPSYSVGDELDHLAGVRVYYNGGVNNVVGRNLTPDGYNLGLKYQCVEFVKRYYYQRYGHKMPNSYGHAKSFYDPALKDGQYNKARGLLQYRNPGKKIPEIGNIVVYDGTMTNRYGHVAIVSNVNRGNNTVEIIQQNGGLFSSTREVYSLTKVENTWLINHKRIKGWLAHIIYSEY